MTDTNRRPVPDRLRQLVKIWNEAGRPSQPSVGWRSDSWKNVLPAYSELFDRLPNPISRDVAASVVAHGSEDSAAEAFVTAMVWGYGRLGYGPFRTARVLAENPNAVGILWEAAKRVHRDGGPEAFAWLARNRLTFLGVAFASKYLFFCNSGQSNTPALVLDQLVQTWLHEHARWRVSLNWHVTDYRQYVQATADWANQLDASPADVEYLIFSDSAAKDPRSQWTNQALLGDTARETRTARHTDLPLETILVLEALDEAAETFAALPDGGDAHDAEDFEHALQQLRRIVLARLS